MVETAKGHRRVEAALTRLVSACISSFKMPLFISYGDCGVPAVMLNPNMSTPSCSMTYFQRFESSADVI